MVLHAPLTFVKAISGIVGKKLTFAKLTGKDGAGELLPA